MVAAVTLFAAGCGGHGALELALVDPAGRNLAKVVDSEPARLLLVELLTEGTRNQRQTDPAPSLLGVTPVNEVVVLPSAAPGQSPSQAQLRALGRAVSVDFAALRFARAIGADEKSRAVQSAFDRALDDGAARSEEINLVAVPVSGSVGRKVYGGYRVLHRHGPNDGVVLLADTVWPGGANLVALGSDHLLAEFHEDARGLAFLRAVSGAVRQHRAGLNSLSQLQSNKTTPPPQC